jgi:hypothetical protein
VGGQSKLRLTMKDRGWPRVGVTAAVLALVAYAVVNHWSDGLEELLKAMAMIVVGYWLGSSRGSAEKNAMIDRASVRDDEGGM